MIFLASEPLSLAWQIVNLIALQSLQGLLLWREGARGGGLVVPVLLFLPKKVDSGAAIEIIVNYPGNICNSWNSKLGTFLSFFKSFHQLKTCGNVASVYPIMITSEPVYRNFFSSIHFISPTHAPRFNRLRFHSGRKINIVFIVMKLSFSSLVQHHLIGGWWCWCALFTNLSDVGAQLEIFTIFHLYFSQKEPTLAEEMKMRIDRIWWCGEKCEPNVANDMAIIIVMMRHDKTRCDKTRSATRDFKVSFWVLIKVFLCRARLWHDRLCMLMCHYRKKRKSARGAFRH